MGAEQQAVEGVTNAVLQKQDEKHGYGYVPLRGALSLLPGPYDRDRWQLPGDWWQRKPSLPLPCGLKKESDLGECVSVQNTLEGL